MKKRLLAGLLGCVLWLGAVAADGAQTAQVQLSNASIRVHRGYCTCGWPNLKWYLYFSTVWTEYTWGINEELAPLPAGSSYSHWTYLLLEDPNMTTSLTYAQVNLPMNIDANANGVADMVEVSQPFYASSSGTYESDWGPNTLTLVWSRPAGQSQGTCDLTMHDRILGDIGPFRHTFEVVQYSGTLTYTPGASSVAGSIALAQVGQPASLIQGPVQWTKSASIPHDELVLQANTWTNSSLEPLEVAESTFTRLGSGANRYRGTVRLGNSDFNTWSFVLCDTNDVNHNGIPDFSDELQAAPRRPGLVLSRAAGALRLSISGEVGRTHLVQEAPTPTNTTWSTVQTVALTNDPHVVTLPLPSQTRRFWRVQAQ